MQNTKTQFSNENKQYFHNLKSIRSFSSGGNRLHLEISLAICLQEAKESDQNHDEYFFFQNKFRWYNMGSIDTHIIRTISKLTLELSVAVEFGY